MIISPSLMLHCTLQSPNNYDLSLVLQLKMSSSNQKTSTAATSSSYFSLTTQNRSQVTRSSSSRSGRIPISETAAYSWLRVQKIMELSVQVRRAIFNQGEKHAALMARIHTASYVICLIKRESDNKASAAA